MREKKRQRTSTEKWRKVNSKEWVREKKEEVNIDNKKRCEGMRKMANEKADDKQRGQ